MQRDHQQSFMVDLNETLVIQYTFNKYNYSHSSPVTEYVSECVKPVHQLEASRWLRLIVIVVRGGVK